jgi:hypothetical protein
MVAVPDAFVCRMCCLLLMLLLQSCCHTMCSSLPGISHRMAGLEVLHGSEIFHWWPLSHVFGKRHEITRVRDSLVESPLVTVKVSFCLRSLGWEVVTGGGVGRGVGNGAGGAVLLSCGTQVPFDWQWQRELPTSNSQGLPCLLVTINAAALHKAQSCRLEYSLQ